jgi:hypothetical protein
VCSATAHAGEREGLKNENQRRRAEAHVQIFLSTVSAEFRS